MLYVEREPSSSYAESFRMIRTNIKYSSIDKNKKVLLITSSAKGEGKSTIAANLAVCIAQDNNKVLIIDCDLRRPNIHRIFNISNSNGVTDYLINEIELKDAVKQHSNKLDIMTSGSMPPNPAEILATNKFDNMLNLVKSEYDYVILDTPPVGTIADTQILATKTDGIILVAEAEETKKNNLLEAKRLIDKVGGKIIGVIINRTKRGKNDDYYYY